VVVVVVVVGDGGGGGGGQRRRPVDLSNTEEEKTMKYGNLTLEINIWKLNTLFMYPQSSQWKERTPKTS